MDLNPDAKQLPSGRPERYDIDDTGVSSPASYTVLKAFDASHIFSKNPRKYDRLIAQEDGYSKDDAGFSDSEVGASRYRSDNDARLLRRSRSSSLTSLDIIAMENALGQSQPIARELDDSKGMVASKTNSADSMYRRCSLDHMADYYTRRTSDAAVSAIWDPSSHVAGQSSTKTTVGSAVASYKPDKKKAEVFGERHLTEIMMKAAFKHVKEPLASPKKEEGGSQDRRASSVGAVPPPISKELHVPQNRRMSLPETAKDVQESPVGEEVSVRMTTVQPQPRRLFGIGPLYHPLPETVIEGVTVTDGPLVSRVKKEGLGTGAEEPMKMTTGKKTAPTKAEMNAWAPFSM